MTREQLQKELAERKAARDLKEKEAAFLLAQEQAARAARDQALVAWGAEVQRVTTIEMMLAQMPSDIPAPTNGARAEEASA
jgi:hypothetical protein